ncbi:MAG TPA: diguanylate cyclase [Gemmatimonadaceae bacterium]|nr:diguanylate cyclase [Gemmatimonadaceae bacterium]
MVEPNVLVAADDPALVSALAWLLKEEGFAVDRLEQLNGGEGLVRRLEARPPDVLVVDVPSAGDGRLRDERLRLVEQVTSDGRWHHLPVLLLAEAPGEDDVARLFGAGATDVVAKPVRVRELVARVQARLRTLDIMHALRDALRDADRAATRARDEVESKRTLVDILFEVTRELSPDEIFRSLARRVARALNIQRCSVVLARPGDEVGVVAAAYEDPSLRDLEIRLDRYPEIRRALDEGVAVLIEDTRASPLYDEVRKTWERDGQVVPTRSVIALPFTLDPERTGVFFLRTDDSELPLTQEDVEFADTVIKGAVAALQRAEVFQSTKAEKEQLATLATTDPLTQLPNRRALVDRLTLEVDRARRYGTVVTLLMVDLDHFKRVNDTYGHLAGDEVLREMAALLQEAARSVDMVARYGGEEFVVVVPETSLDGALAFAERLRERVEGQAFSTGGRTRVRLTASVGVAGFPAPGVESVDALFSRADAALYQAKAEGRNRVRG